MTTSLFASAAWIGSTAETPTPGKRPAYTFRTGFHIDSLPSTARLFATAHGIYEAFVNGMRVGDEELTPGVTNYRKTLYMQQFDVLEFLHEGENTLELVVSDGWFRGKCGPRRLADNFGSDVAVIARLTADDEPLVETSGAWEWGIGAITRADLMDGQTSDLRRIGGEEWAPVRIVDDVLTRDASRLALSPAPPVRRKERYEPVSITRLPSGRQIVDFGQILNGWVRLARLGGEGTVVSLIHGEALDASGDLTLDNIDYFQGPGKPKLGVGQRDEVISRGVVGDVFEPRHTTHGFRYVAIDGLREELGAGDISAIQVRTDLRRIGEFSSSDPRLDELHRIAVASWHANTCDIPTDCPQRERWGYTGDYQIFIRSAAFIDDVRGFSAKWLRSVADDQREDGCVLNVSPHCGVAPPTPQMPISFDGAAGWGDASTIVPWELYRQYGDVEVLRENLPTMVRWVEYAANMAATTRHRSRQGMEARSHEKYLWDSGWQWGEWLEPDVEFDWASDKSIVATAYLAHSAKLVADAAELLGDAATVIRFREIQEGAMHAWRTEFLEDDGSLTQPTQANYVRALAFGLIPERLAHAAAGELATKIEEAGGHLSTGFLTTGLLLPVLADHGYVDLAYRVLFQDSEPSWMTMLDRGATTVWEAWNGIDANGVAHDSLNHYSKGAVIAFLHEYIAGIQPAAPGYAAIRIAPHPHPRLERASATIETPYGAVSSSWRIVDGAFLLDVVTPAGVATEIELPDGRRETTEGGTHTFRSDS